jgi:hypothetical protein
MRKAGMLGRAYSPKLPSAHAGGAGHQGIGALNRVGERRHRQGGLGSEFTEQVRCLPGHLLVGVLEHLDEHGHDSGFERAPSLPPRLSDCDQLLPRPEEQRAIRNRRRRHAGFMQLIGSQERVRSCRRHHKHDSLFAGEIDVPPVRYR